ncbi:MAG TPA: hypothetical protein VF618_21055 [Thermoanaerobaculia bacterium]
MDRQYCIHGFTSGRFFRGALQPWMYVEAENPLAEAVWIASEAENQLDEAVFPLARSSMGLA